MSTPTPEASGEPLSDEQIAELIERRGRLARIDRMMAGSGATYAIAATEGEQTVAALRELQQRRAAALPAAQVGDVAVLLDRLRELETTCILESENATDQGQAPEASVEAPDDYDWALARVQQLMASAYADARVHGLKLLKGFGWPDEVMCRAQDYRALSIVLEYLAALQRARETGAKA